MQKIRKYKGFKDFVFTAIVIFLIYSFLHLFPFNSTFASELQESSLAIAIKQYHEGKFTEAIYNLEIALSRSLSKQEKATAYLYLGRCYIITGKPDKADTCFKEALRADPFLQLEDFDSPQIVNAFTKSKNALPLITEFTVFPDRFHPYAEEHPGIEFRLSQRAETKFNINDLYNKTVHTEKYQGLEGFNRFYWGWENNLLLLKSGTYFYKLNAEDMDGDYYLAEKKVDIKIKIPSPLRFDGSRFYIPQENFKPEYEERYDYPKNQIAIAKTMAYGGTVSFLVGIGIMSWIENSGKESDISPESMEKIGKVGSILLKVGLCAMVGGLAWNASLDPTPKYKKVMLTENIRYNAQLQKKIDELLKKVEVEQKAINKEKKE